MRPIRGPAILRIAQLAIAPMCGVAMLWALPAEAQRAARFDIPAQNLATALDSFARQANVQLLYPYPVAAARRSTALRGEMPVRAALDLLLRGSGLEVARFGERTVTLRAAPVRKAKPAPAPRLPARRKPAAPPAAPKASPPEEIVVTGRAASTPLADTELSYAVTRIDADALARRGPLSTADLFKQIPGFWVESTGGEASNNVRSRGIPTDGYSSVALLEDGLPIQYDGGLGYLNTDQIHRLDATVARVEAVRGGPSAIFTPNAPGGSINFVTRTGLADPGYTLSATGGSFGYARIDGFAGMRITPELGVSLGGFYRRADGLRDPGYTGDRGGQIRAGIDYDDGRARLSFNVKRLDDRVVLYLPVPLRLDDRGTVRGIPGFDPLRDTLAGPDNVAVPFKTASGPRLFDLSQGTRSRITFYTLSGRYAFDAATALEVKARLRTGSTLRNGLFPVGRPMGGGDYIASVRSQLAAAYPAMAAVRLRYADGGAAFQPASNGNGLVASANLLSVAMPMREFVIDTRLTHSFDRWGHHEFAAGVTHDNARLDFDRSMGTVLLDIRGQARRLDVIALDGNGNQIGALTDNGFTRYGSLFDNAVLRSSNLAFYLADEWKIAPRWRVDLGMRWEHVGIGGRMETAAPIDLGDSATLADNAVLTGTGTFTPIRRRFSGWSGTAGVNFTPSRHAGIFARLTRIARLPSATEFTSTPNRTDEAIVPIVMAEAGLILHRPSWNLSAVAFHTRFKRLPFTDYRFDPQTNAYVNRTSIADTATLGLELAGHAELAGPLALDVQATLQDPRYRNFSYIELVGGQPVSRDATGNQLIRVPRVSLSATPSLKLFAGRLRLDLELVHHSERYADIANSQRLPAFSLININANAKLGGHAALALHITNLTNALGLTEGNPRLGAFDTGGVGSRYFFARPEFGRTARMVLSLAF